MNPFQIDIMYEEFTFPKYLLSKKAVAIMELIEIQEDSILRMHHKSSESTKEFWKIVPDSKYLTLKNACKLISIFATIYFCEILNSTMNLT